MSDEYTEEEEKLLSWFKDNLKSMLIGLFAGIFLILAYKYYIDYQDQITSNLSFEYETTLNKYREGNLEYLLEKDKQLSQDHPSNIYTNLINLYSVKIFVNNKEIDKAFDKLNFIISNSSSQHIKIKTIDPYEKNYILVELLGDIYYKDGEIELAKQKYNAVLNFTLTPNKLKILENKINTIK